MSISKKKASSSYDTGETSGNSAVLVMEVTESATHTSASSLEPVPETNTNTKRNKNKPRNDDDQSGGPPKNSTALHTEQIEIEWYGTTSSTQSFLDRIRTVSGQARLKLVWSEQSWLKSYERVRQACGIELKQSEGQRGDHK